MKTRRRHPAGGGGIDAVRWVIRHGVTRVVSHSLVLALCATEHCHVEREAVSWEGEVVEACCCLHPPLAVSLTVNFWCIIIPVAPQKTASPTPNTYRYYCSLHFPLHQKRPFADICRLEACFCSQELHYTLFRALRSAMLTRTVQSSPAAGVENSAPWRRVV